MNKIVMNNNENNNNNINNNNNNNDNNNNINNNNNLNSENQIKNNKNIENSDIEKLTQKTINENIYEDLHLYITFYSDNNNTYSQYDWSIVEFIFNKGNSLNELIIGYIESIYDLLTNKNKLYYINEYFKEIISYYSKSLNDEDIRKIKSNIIFYLFKSEYFPKNNKFIHQCWGNIIYQLLSNNILTIDDFDFKNTKIDRGILKHIFIIIKFVCEFAENKETLKYFRKLRFVVENQRLFEKIINNKNL